MSRPGPTAGAVGLVPIVPFWGQGFMVGLRRLLLAALAILAMAASARADDLHDLIDRLGAESFADKEQAVTALGELGDGRAVPALKALNDGLLYRTADGHVVVAEQAGNTNKLFDPEDHAALGEAKDDAIDKVRVNNRLRGTISGALSRLTLVSTNRDDRLDAARDALKHLSEVSTPALEHALQSEKDPEVRRALTLALSAAHLTTGTNEQRIAAISALTQSSDPEIRSLLGQLANNGDLDPAVRKALEAAQRSLEQRLMWIGFAENLFQGLSLGSVLLLAAIGLAITFGVMGVINMAHGEMIMLGAYTTFVVQEIFRAFLPPAWIDSYLIVSVPAAFLVAGLVGIVLERSIIRFLYGRPLETMLATWGVSLILQQLVRTVFGAPNKEVSNPSWMTGGIDVLGGATITWNRIVILAFCSVVMVCLALLLRRTSFGLHMRAVTQNRDMAAVMGIPTARIDALTFGFGSGIAGIGGVALSQIGNVSPNLGTIYIVDSFLVVVFGGVGSLMGTLVGALGLGVANKLLEPVAGAVLGKVAILLAIILFIQKRPRGLFALKGRAAES
ncbi:MAG TPA: urea ABC transporter permease subunit UrtB [Stellaceae bacterium]|nr:urea ABC transporter permease subunit UrtB [Stellaceae bacterium]